MKKFILKPIIIMIQKTAMLSALACRVVKWTGKHPDPVHPKHLINLSSPWYLRYISSSSSVLDIGCHNGQRTVKAAQVAKYAHGFDYDQKQLTLAKKEAKRLKVKNINFIKSNAESIFPYKNNFFDVVLFLDVLEHLHKRDFALKEVRRVLKPQGLLLLSIPNSKTSWKKLQRLLDLPYFSDPDHKVEFSQTEIINLVKKHNFLVRSIQSVTLDTPIVGLIDLCGGFSLALYKRLATWRRQKVMDNPRESIGFEIVCEKA